MKLTMKLTVPQLMAVFPADKYTFAGKAFYESHKMYNAQRATNITNAVLGLQNIPLELARVIGEHASEDEILDIRAASPDRLVLGHALNEEVQTYTHGARNNGVSFAFFVLHNDLWSDSDDSDDDDPM